MTKEKTIERSYPSRPEIEAWLIANHTERQEALTESLERGRFDIIVPDILRESPSLYLVKPNGERIPLAMVIYAVKPKNPNQPETNPIEIGELDCAFENPVMMIYEPPEENSSQRYEQLGKYLFPYFTQLLPQSGEKPKPIRIFRSASEYRRQLPIVRLRLTGKLVTAKFSRSKEIGILNKE